LHEVLKSGGRSASQGSHQQRLAKLLVVTEVTLTVVLLAAASLLIQTANQFASAPLGFEPNGLFLTSVGLPQTGYQTAERQLQLYDHLESRLRQAPAVRGMALSSSRPVDGGGAQNVIVVEGHAPPRVENMFDTLEQTITADYFNVMKTPLLKGRLFAAQDTQRAEGVAIVNDALVREYFGQQDPIGMHIRPFREGKNTAPWLRVVGVVENQKRTTVYREMAWAEQPVLYRPFSQNPQRSAIVLLRVAGSPPPDFGAGIQRQIAALDPELPIDEVQPVSDLESQATAYPQFRARLLGSFAGLALILAAAGLFGVLSQLVAQRTQEIGVRVALGAQRMTILLMILKEGLFLTGIGMALGLASAWALGHYLSALLYGVKAGDPLLFSTLAAALLLVALFAMYIPAWRAAKVDPMIALRNE
jgi:predicted permease